MSKIEWDKTGEKLYETGVKNGVLYLPDESGAYTNGVAWNGLTSVKESPSGAEATPLYADDIKYLELTSAEEFGGTLECYTYPDEFAECDYGLMIDNSNVLISCWNHEKHGGTWYTIRYALQQENIVEIININPMCIISYIDYY